LTFRVGLGVVKDYYGILGVSPEASQEEIRRAYRKRAHKCHPDVCKGKDHREFVEAKEAYDVLANPDRRRQYDLDRAASNGKRNFAIFESFREPQSDFRFPHTEVGRMLDNMFRDFFGQDPKPEPSYDLEVFLTPEEARRGGAIRVEIPVQGPCPHCQADYVNRFFCDHCSGLGRIKTIHRSKLVIPPNIQSGIMLNHPFRHGSSYLNLRVMVRVEE